MREKIVGSRLRRFMEKSGDIGTTFVSTINNQLLDIRYHDVGDDGYVQRHAKQLEDAVHVRLIGLLIERFCPLLAKEPYHWAIFLHEDKCMMCVRGPGRMDIFFLEESESRLMIPWARNNSRLIDRRVGELWNLGDPDITTKFKEALARDQNAINGFGIDKHLFERSSLLAELRKSITSPRPVSAKNTVESINKNKSTKG